MIQVKARQQGGSVVISIPAVILKLRNIRAGDVLDLDVLPDGFEIRKAEPPSGAALIPGTRAIPLMVSRSQRP